MHISRSSQQKNDSDKVPDPIVQLVTGIATSQSKNTTAKAVLNSEQQQMANNSLQVQQLSVVREMAQNSPRVKQLKAYQEFVDQPGIKGTVHSKNSVVQRAIGAEIETNLQVKKKGENVPMVGQHEDLVGTIATPYGRQNIVIDTGTIMEITTDPKSRSTVQGTSELPNLLGYLAREMKSDKDPKFGVELTEKFKEGEVGFKSGTSRLTGDIQVNVSPLDSGSVRKYYNTIAERRNRLEKLADDQLEPFMRKRIWKEQQLDVVRNAIEEATTKAVIRQSRALLLRDTDDTAAVRGIEEILIRTILDMVMNLNLRPHDSATDKNMLDILPKFDIQEKLNEYSFAASKIRVGAKRGNEKAILFSSLSEAIESTSSIIRKMEKSGAVGSMLQMINDVYDVVLNGRRTIRNRKGESAGNMQMDPLINIKTSTNMIPKENARNGVYEDRNPFKPSLIMGSLEAESWESQMTDYEIGLLVKGVNYLT